jgi:hypothetical protein
MSKLKSAPDGKSYPTKRKANQVAEKSAPAKRRSTAMPKPSG